jgi:hypothetical protein
MSTAAVFLDIEKAFDTTWHPGLLYKLSKLEFSAQIIKLISSFLSNRKFRVSVEGEMSMPREMQAGVPQGSVLSPTLYSIYIVTYSGSIRDGTLLHPKSQYTTVKHSQKLFEHTYTSDPHGLGTHTPIEFFQQDLMWQSSNTHSHSCSHKAFKHTSGQSFFGLSVHLHTTTALRRIVHH